MMSYQPVDRAVRSEVARLEIQPSPHREHFQESRRSSQPVPAATRVELSPEFDVTTARQWYLPVKVVIDGFLGAVLLVVTGPVMLVAALLVKLTSRGPAFYCQVRQGKGGRPFTLYKLRTMVDKAEAMTGPVWSCHNDARVTRLGAVLRKTHIDEFPQLWNVIRGDMSLIGPRPERPEIAATLEWQIPAYSQRLEVRPGITGFAQVRLPPDTDLDSVRQKIVYDLYYVKYASPWLDLRLLLATGWSLVREISRFAWNTVALPAPGVVRDATPLLGDIGEQDGDSFAEVSASTVTMQTSG